MYVPTRAGKNDCPTKTVKSVEQPFDALQELSKPWNNKYASNFRNREQTQ
jgi:hypothetical protein